MKTFRFLPGATMVLGVALAFVTPSRGGAVALCGLGNAVHTCLDQDSSVAGEPVTDSSEHGDRFGAALAFGDFDGDDRDDLAVGVPDEDSVNELQVGAVHVFYGSGLAIGLARQQYFDQDDVAGDDGDTEFFDRFGFALATGDFNGDGFDDLAVGSPLEDYPETNIPLNCEGTCDNSGLVHVIPGSSAGLRPADAITMNGDQIGAALDGETFGFALATGRNGSDAFDDLFVGAPSRFVGSCCGGKSGQAFLVPGSATGPDVSAGAGLARTSRSGPEDFAASNLAFIRGSDGPDFLPAFLVSAVPRGDDTNGHVNAGFVEMHAVDPKPQPPFPLEQRNFGTADNESFDEFSLGVAAGDFDGDGRGDFAAGAPGKEHGPGSPADSGRVYVAFGGFEPGEQDRHQFFGEDFIPGQIVEPDEGFGSALVAADLDGDGDDDLLVGAPEEGVNQQGAVFLFDGGALGLAARPGSPGGFLESGPGGNSETGDRFGAVLARGDVDGDGVDEIAIGVPDEDVGTIFDAGMVYVTRLFDPRLVFVDGFESSGTALWSASVP